MSDYSELKRVAEAATPGPWYQHGGIMQVLSHDCETVCETFEDDGECPDAQFIAAANPAAVLALIAENEQLAKTADCWDRLNVQNKALSDSFRAERDQAEQDYKDVVGTIELRDIEISKLRAEIAGLRTGYEAYEQVVQGLKAENEALRDDLEQVQYEADAWRNREESLWIEVYYGKGDDPSISAVQGAICIEELAKIQGVFLEYPDDYFEHGSGLYVFRCGHHEAHYDNVGMTEPAHWEIEFESHSRFPWADEQPSTCGSEQDQNSTETPIPERSACRSESP